MNRMSEGVSGEAQIVDPQANLHPGRQQHQMRMPELLGISSFWFGTNVHWTMLMLILMPHQVGLMAAERKSLVNGLTLGAGALFALVIPLVVGPLSDRCMSRFGRRRPFMVVGVATNVVGL